MGEFDKLLKQNIEALFMPLSEKLLGIRIASTREITEKFQTTIEREPDFLKWVTDEDGQEFLLHIEFQTQDDPEMVYRMAEYKALLLRKFRVPVQQFVLYLGSGISRMKTYLPAGQEITGYDLKNLSEMSLDQSMKSMIPEEIILAILSDYPSSDGKQVIRRIIRRLQDIMEDATLLQRYVQQLIILSRLRKLDKETKEIAQEMPITYDIKTDAFYQEGQETVILNMLRKGTLSAKEISDLTDVPLAKVEALQKKLGE